MTPELTGLWPPVSTPFAGDGSVASSRLIEHSRALLAEGAAGLAILGTTSEANSLTFAERQRVIDAHVEAGIPGAQLLPGTGATAIDDAAALTRHAAGVGCAGVLLLSPFYYKGVSDDGLFAFAARVIERCGPKIPPVMLYHIPRMAGTGWSLEVVGRLRDAFPEVIAGMKDSSGDAGHTRQMVEAFPDLAIFPGAETYLVDALGWGARGCISATANINAGAIARMIEHPDSPDAAAQQKELIAVRSAAERRGMIPALKAVLAARYGSDDWINVRPPLMPLTEEARSALLADPAIAGLVERTDA